MNLQDSKISINHDLEADSKVKMEEWRKDGASDLMIRLKLLNKSEFQACIPRRPTCAMENHADDADVGYLCHKPRGCNMYIPRKSIVPRDLFSVLQPVYSINKAALQVCYCIHGRHLHHHYMPVFVLLVRSLSRLRNNGTPDLRHHRSWPISRNWTFFPTNPKMTFCATILREVPLNTALSLSISSDLLLFSLPLILILSLGLKSRGEKFGVGLIMILGLVSIGVGLYRIINTHVHGFTRGTPLTIGARNSYIISGVSHSSTINRIYYWYCGYYFIDGDGYASPHGICDSKFESVVSNNERKTTEWVKSEEGQHTKKRFKWRFQKL